MNNETELSAQSEENIQKMYVKKIIEYLKGNNYDKADKNCSKRT